MAEPVITLTGAATASLPATDLAIEAGITGAIGSGVPALLRALAGDEPLTAGEVAGSEVYRVGSLARAVEVVVTAAAAHHTGRWRKPTVADAVATIEEVARPEVLKAVGLSDDHLGARADQVDAEVAVRVLLAAGLASGAKVLLIEDALAGAADAASARVALLSALAGRVPALVVAVEALPPWIGALDRLVVADAGAGVLQTGPPLKVLAAPASPAVAAALGPERARLLQEHVRVGQLEPRPGPALQHTAATADARRLMSQYGVSWALVLRGPVLLGFVTGAQLADTTHLAGVEPLPVTDVVQASQPLADALAAAVASPLDVAVVVDGSHYVGLLRPDDLVRLRLG